MEKIKETLLKNRPKLSNGSLTTYLSILKNLYYRHNDKNKEINLEWFNTPQKEILKYLEDFEPKKRKTILSALIVYLNGEDNKCNLYRERMMKDLEVSKAIDIEQKKTEKQKDNWINYDEIKILYDKMYKTIKPFLTGKKNILEGEDKQRLQNFILFGLTSGVLGILPRRSLDWTEMVLKDPTEKDNYMTKNQFIFNRFKTDKFSKDEYRIVDIPKETLRILNAYKKTIPLEQKYMFVDKNGNKLNPVKLNQRLNKVFEPKNVSVSMLRHIFLTEKYKNLPKLEEFLKTSNGMDHSLEKSLEYIKKD